MKPAIPFLDLKAVNLQHRAKFHDALDRVLDSGQVLQGEETRRLEIAFSGYCESTHCIAVSNGLDALKLVLQAWGIGAGDEVIVPAHTFVATWLAVMHTGARPVGVDVDAESFNVDPGLVESAITPRTKAIIPVHLYGRPADMEAIMTIAAKYNLKVLEDAAQAHGARYHGKRSGSLGHAAAFSFYPGKNLGALGDAGAITTDDTALAARVRMLANYGAEQKYHHVEPGWNCRMDELQAAFLAEKLKRLDADNAIRRAIAARYNATLQGVALPRAPSEIESSWHLYVIQHPRREALMDGLHEAGIGSLIHYPIPPHLQPACHCLGYTAGAFPVSERLANQVLSLPIGPAMPVKDVERVVTVLNKLAAA